MHFPERLKELDAEGKPRDPWVIPHRRGRDEFIMGFKDGMYQGWGGDVVQPTYPATRNWIDGMAGRTHLQHHYMVGHVAGQCYMAGPLVTPAPYYSQRLHQDIARVSFRMF